MYELELDTQFIPMGVYTQDVDYPSDAVQVIKRLTELAGTVIFSVLDSCCDLLLQGKVRNVFSGYCFTWPVRASCLLTFPDQICRKLWTTLILNNFVLPFGSRSRVLVYPHGRRILHRTVTNLHKP